MNRYMDIEMDMDKIMSMDKDKDKNQDVEKHKDDRVGSGQSPQDPIPMSQGAFNGQLEFTFRSIADHVIVQPHTRVPSMHPTAFPPRCATVRGFLHRQDLSESHTIALSKRASRPGKKRPFGHAKSAEWAGKLDVYQAFL
ncbi:hypothetical protein AYL99_11837 [Fonsecaea erecta]|uniref:Uncharacterized protein n=1 Tax=Fonsecaea erecta TaxID=1367422 RepID=A0A178Z2L0_9EURO|nr:hypothetical protein AYL99_11837 [Fonsecaea erecta]OAP53957.1 hypothetical protein AYL99_11837 [Fonsecaea erecta]